MPMDAQGRTGYIIEQLYSQNEFLLEGDLLNGKEKSYFRSVRADMENYVLSSSLKTLPNFLYRYQGKTMPVSLNLRYRI